MSTLQYAREVGGLKINGCFVYRAWGPAASAWCGKTHTAPFKPSEFTCRACWLAIVRFWRRAAEHGLAVPEWVNRPVKLYAEEGQCAQAS